MITQTLAIFLDAYRELNAKKLFWITLILSGLVVAVLGSIGIDQQGVTFWFWRMSWIPVNSNLLSPNVFYSSLFSGIGINLWLRWIATILALVSTAGIVPDLVAGGTIETVLSKPISRARLLLTKLATGLLFAALQVFVFSLGCFLVFGLRAGVWNFGLFLAVPIVLLFYSYLYGMLALLGMITRSTVASLLLTALLWGVLVLVNIADLTMTSISSYNELVVEKRVERIELMETNTRKLIIAQRTEPSETAPTDEEVLEANPFLAGQHTRLEQDRKTLGQIKWWTDAVWVVKTVLPKTGETIALLERSLIDPSDMPQPEPTEPEFDLADPEQDIMIEDEQFGQRVEEKFRDRPLWWIIGTSLVFEFVIIGITTLIFVRRDF